MGHRWTLSAERLVGGLWSTYICLDGRPAARSCQTWADRPTMDRDIAVALGALDGPGSGRVRTHEGPSGAHVTIDVDGRPWFESLVSWDDPDDALVAGMGMLTCILEATAPLVRLGVGRQPDRTGG